MKIFSLHSAPLTGLVSQTSENKVASSQFGAQYDDRGLKLRTRLWLLQRVLSQTSAKSPTVVVILVESTCMHSALRCTQSCNLHNEENAHKLRQF